MTTYFERVQPTYIEAWPKELCSLSIAQVAICLDLRDAVNLGCANGEWGEAFRGAIGDVPADLTRIEEKLDEAISKFPNGAFVRLGSRSPKDSWVLCREGARVTSGKEALRRLTDSSERIHDDLSLAFANKYDPWLFVRQWIDIHPETEFRCFMKNRKLVGISQYQYRDAFPWVKENKEGIHFAIEEFFHDFRKASHLDDVVFDVFVKLRRRGNESEWEVKLLEINPFFEMTDPCLFDWRNGGDFDGSFRIKKKEEKTVSTRHEGPVPDLSIPANKDYPPDAGQCDTCGGLGCNDCDGNGWIVPKAGAAETAMAEKLMGQEVGLRRCENPSCRAVLPPGHIAVYCSNECALDDA